MARKYTKVQLEKIYDALYARAEKILNKFNPCEHEVSLIKKIHSCVGSRSKNTNNPAPHCCCAGCGFWTNKGCGANKPLTCRTWLCTAVKLKHKETVTKLDRIAKIAIKMGFYVFRGDREMSIKQALKYQNNEN